MILKSENKILCEIPVYNSEPRLKLCFTYAKCYSHKFNHAELSHNGVSLRKTVLFLEGGFFNSSLPLWKIVW